MYKISLDVMSLVFSVPFAPFENISLQPQTPKLNKTLRNHHHYEGRDLVKQATDVTWLEFCVSGKDLPSFLKHFDVSPFMRRLQQRAGTCCFGRWSVRVIDRCPSSALRPAGPACWVPGSKDGDPGPVLTNHPDLHCPRGRTPDSLWTKPQVEIQSIYLF